MKIKFKQKKPYQLKRYFTKIRMINRWGFFYPENNQWISASDYKNIDKLSCKDCADYQVAKNNLKANIRLLKKSSKFIPKGTKFVLENEYKGYEVIIII